MKADHIEIHIKVSEEERDLVMAVLAEAGCDTFQYSPDGLLAYLNAEAFDPEAITEKLRIHFGQGKFGFEFQLMKSRNWNREWEENYPSVYIENFCQIVPSFREPADGFTYTLVIEPKMSFGTGNHESTRLMIRLMQMLDLAGKKVLDMGCGTGILSILSEKMGANSICGIDIDAWSSENAAENIALNECGNIRILQGDANDIPREDFDMILANINRNVLINDAEKYVQRIQHGGMLLISGILAEDTTHIIPLYEKLNLKPKLSVKENDWRAWSFVKNN